MEIPPELHHPLKFFFLGFLWGWSYRFSLGRYGALRGQR